LKPTPVAAKRILSPTRPKPQGTVQPLNVHRNFVTATTTTCHMEELEGEGFRELLLKKFNQLKEWVKPNPVDTTLVKSLKMIYKVLAVLVLIAFSPVLIVILVFVFFAAV
jgi:hypothetical protein